MLSPAIQPWLEATTPPVTAWGWVFGLALAPVTVVDVMKLAGYSRRRE